MSMETRDEPGARLPDPEVHPTMTARGEPTHPEFLTADDLCDRWRTTPAHIKSLRLRGELGFVRVGRLTRFPLADVLAFEQRNTVRARPSIATQEES